MSSRSECVAEPQMLGLLEGESGAQSRNIPLNPRFPDEEGSKAEPPGAPDSVLAGTLSCE